MNHFLQWIKLVQYGGSHGFIPEEIILLLSLANNDIILYARASNTFKQ